MAMQKPPIYSHIRDVYHSLQYGTFEDRDAALTALHTVLEKHATILWPTWIYPVLQHLLTYYMQAILPDLPISPGDRAFFQEAVDATRTRLRQQASRATRVEARLANFLQAVQAKKISSIRELVGNLFVCFATPFQETPRVPKTVERDSRPLLKAPFTFRHILPLFETLLTATWFAPYYATFAPFQYLFWDQMLSRLYPLAVLVNGDTRQGTLARLEVTTGFSASGLDGVAFDQTSADEAMQRSCSQALLAARAYLDTHFPERVRQRALLVTCRFPNPAAVYNDQSAGLLVGLSVVGGVLDLETPSGRVATGVVDADGMVRPVEHLPQKLDATEHEAAIECLIYPADAGLLSSRRIRLEPVRTFEDALQAYYGKPLQRKLQAVSRRQIFTGGLAALSVMTIGGFTVRKFFRNSPTEEERFLLEYAQDLCQNQSNHLKAKQVLRTLLRKIHNLTFPNARRLEARVYTELGINATQQHHLQEALSHLQHACTLWEGLRDHEQQAQTLLAISSVYYHAVTSDGAVQSANMCLKHLEWAHELLTPSMPQFSKIMGECYGITGSLYDGLAEYQKAKAAMEQSMKHLEEIGETWSYHLTKQCLGRMLVRSGDVEQAGVLLEESLTTPILQRPYNRVRGFRGMSELCFATGETNTGVEWARKAKHLCQEHEMQGQRFALSKMLARYNVHSDVLIASD